MLFSAAVKDQAFVRSRGRCECRRSLHAHKSGRCHHVVARHTAQYHALHDHGDAGTDVVANCEVLCPYCQMTPYR